MKCSVERIFAEDAPRQTAWAVIETDSEGRRETVDYRSTKAEALWVAKSARKALAA